MSIKRQAGLTIIELVMFIVIMGVAVTGVLGVISTVTSRGGDPLQHKQAILRAEAVLEEIALAHFTYCHPTDAAAESANGSTLCASPSLQEDFGRQVASDARPFFNINDYVPAAGVATPITTDANGLALQPAGYATTVAITPVQGFGPAGLQIGTIPSPVTANSDVLRISVTVAYAGGAVTLDRYRTRYAPTSMP